MSLPIRVVERFGYLANGDGHKAQLNALRRLRSLHAEGYVGDMIRWHDLDLGDCWIVRAFLRDALPLQGTSRILNTKQMGRHADR